MVAGNIKFDPTTPALPAGFSVGLGQSSIRRKLSRWGGGRLFSYIRYVNMCGTKRCSQFDTKLRNCGGCIVLSIETFNLLP